MAMGSPNGAEFKISTRVPGIKPIVISRCLSSVSPSESILTTMPGCVSLSVNFIISKNFFDGLKFITCENNYQQSLKKIFAAKKSGLSSSTTPNYLFSISAFNCTVPIDKPAEFVNFLVAVSDENFRRIFRSSPRPTVN